MKTHQLGPGRGTGTETNCPVHVYRMNTLLILLEQRVRIRTVVIGPVERQYRKSRAR